MEELIVRVCRALACESRLRILAALARTTETAASELACQLDMPKSLLSNHLRVLSAVGLTQSRRSGVWCYCRLASPYGIHTLSGQLTKWLRRVFAEPERTAKNRRVHELCDSSSEGAEAALIKLVFEAATAFTNVRRVQVLRRLAVGDCAGVAALSAEFSMSEDAVGRHLSKLARRGYVVSHRTGRALTHALTDDFKCPLHRRMFEIVSSVWTKTDS